MSHTQVTIEIKAGKLAPRYSQEVCDRELSLEKVVITEECTVSDLPIVDFQFRDKAGKEYFSAVTGRIAIAVAAAIRGVNLRMTGKENP